MSAQNVDIDELIRGRGSRRRWFVLAGVLGILAAAAIAFCLLALGPDLQIGGSERLDFTRLPYNWFVQKVPLLNAARDPGRFVSVALLCLAVLVGLGLLIGLLDRTAQGSNVIRTIEISRHGSQRRLPLQRHQGAKDLIIGRGGRRRAVLRVEREEQQPLAALLMQAANHAVGRGVAIAHAEVDHHLIAEPVSRRVNNVINDDPDCLTVHREFDAASQGALFG